MPDSTGEESDEGSIPESGRSPGVGSGIQAQYSCLEKPLDRETQKSAVHKVAKSQTRLKQLSTRRQQGLGKPENQ